MSNKSSSEKPNLPQTESSLTVVGIGTSAGGLTALKTFFTHVPEDSGLAFVVVMHLSPTHESHLSDVLQPHVRMPVQQVTETILIRANHVYLIPPGRNLDAIDTHLRLSEMEAHRKDRAPIDHFFRTLAQVHDGHSVGIILTGTGSDGTLGIKEVKGEGGLTVVQEPQEAEYDGMPQSAISTGLIDLVLPLAEMPRHIIRYARTQPRIAVSEEDEALEKDEPPLLHKIFARVKSQTGRDFSRYKRSTVLRRLRRRMQLAQLEELPDYVRLLHENRNEVVALSDDFLINVTNFFRDTEVFEHLGEQVIPRLFEGKGPEQSVRVWSVGCSTGEEAYSLMILLLEEAGRREKPRGDARPELQLFASDLHEDSLQKAREGFYPGDIETYVSAERLRRFFVREKDGYRIRSEVRGRVVFAPHNIMGDPPFSQLDLIVCRNVLIYLQREVQRDIIDLFHYALRPDGFLLLGTSETIESSELFRVVDKKHCLFDKRNVPAPELHLPVFPMKKPRPPLPVAPGEPASQSVTYGALHQRMVERYAPPSLLVNPNHKVVHLSEHVSRYLAPSGGEATTNIFKLVRPEFHLELRATLHEARNKGQRVRSRFVAAHLEGADCWVVLTVYPSEEPQQEGFMVVLFDAWEVEPASEKPGGGAASPLASSPGAEEELAETRQRLQTVIEELENGQEDMKASHEEMQSTNEELRSTMEELETSKEELQSMNEELSTLNQENRNKVEELSQLSGDLQNLLASTNIATLFLDRAFRIVRFTPQASELFNIRYQDRSRPLSDLTHRLGYDDLLEDAQRVLDTLVPVEREVPDEEGRWYLTRVLPYRSAQDHIGGVVITFIDITSRKQSEEHLLRSEEHLRLIIESATGYAIFTLDTDRTVTGWNTGAERILGYQKEQIVGQSADLLFVPEDRDTEPEREINQARELDLMHHERWYLRRDGSRFLGSGTLMPLLDKNRTLRGFLKIMFDNTERQRIEEVERAAQAKQDFLAHMSHEIRTPLNAIVGLSDLLLRQNPPPAQLENLETLKFSADNLKMLVNDILDFSKIQAGKVMVDDMDVHVQNLLHSLEKAHQAGAAERGNALRFQVDEQIPNIIRTDSLKLSQVLNNLIGNAVKFTRQGVVTVDVSLQRQEEEASWITFSVQDTGVGIAADKLTTIFDAFTQADISTEREYGGTGLGLSITKLLLELMSSRIEVESEVGTGSRFFFTLPLREGSREAAPDSVAFEPPEAPEPLENLRLLLAEDSAINRMILVQFLQEWWGLTPDEAEDGQQAVAMVQQKQCDGDPYDLILMDIRMPVMDGYEAARAIRKLPGAYYQQVPILAITADTVEEVHKHAEATLFSDVVTKPFNPQELRQKIRQYATRPTGQDNGLVLDLQKLEAMFQGDQPDIRRFLKKVSDELTPLRQTYARAVAERDEAALGNMIHKETVLLDTLALSELKALLEQSRKLVQEKADEEALAEVQRKTEESLERAVAALHRQLP